MTVSRLNEVIRGLRAVAATPQGRAALKAQRRGDYDWAPDDRAPDTQPVGGTGS